VTGGIGERKVAESREGGSDGFALVGGGGHGACFLFAAGLGRDGVCTICTHPLPNRSVRALTAATSSSLCR
jgi:hypothetical protein